MMISRVVLALLILALLLAGVVATETRLLFLWPSCALLGLAGLLQVLGPRVRVPHPPSDICLGTALLLAVYAGGRAAVSPVLEHAREDFFMGACALGVYVMMATVGAGSKERGAFLGVLLALAAGNAAVGAAHFGGDWEFHVVPNFARSFEEGRIGGFYNNPNHLAAFLSLVVFMSLGQVCYGRGTATWRMVLVFVVVTAMLGMALTVSRGALLGLGAGAAVFALLGIRLVWQCRRHLAGRLIWASAALTLVLGGVLWKVNEEYLRRRVAEQAATADVRLDIWRAALEQHADQPLTGAGARMFYEGGVRHRQPEVPKWVGEPEFAHNEYVQMLADYGWAGLALLAAALAAHLGNGWRFARWFAREGFQREGRLASSRLALATGATAALAASAAHAVVEFHWHVGSLAVLTAGLAGILANPGIEGAAGRPRRVPGVRPLLKLALLVFSACLLAGAMTWGRADWMHAAAVIQAGKGGEEEALERMERAGALDPRSASKAVERAEARLELLTRTETAEARKELLEGARGDLERAAALNPFDFLIATNLADVYFALGRQEQAASEIRRAISLAPLYEEPRLALALYHHRRREFREAEAAYLWASEAGAGNAPGTVTWLAAYRQLLMDAGSLPPPAETGR